MLNLAVPIALATIGAALRHRRQRARSLDRHVSSVSSAGVTGDVGCANAPLVGARWALAGGIGRLLPGSARLIQLRRAAVDRRHARHEAFRSGRVLAILVLARKPGGKAPDWLQELMGLKPPFRPVPGDRGLFVIRPFLVHFGLMRTSYGGGAARRRRQFRTAIHRAGWSLLGVQGSRCFALRRDVRRPSPAMALNRPSPPRPTPISANGYNAALDRRGHPRRRRVRPAASSRPAGAVIGGA